MELKPCPLGEGKEVEVFFMLPKHGDPKDFRPWHVMCKNCGCLASGRTKEEAIEIWNRRAGND